MKWLSLFILNGFALLHAQQLPLYDAVQDSIINQLALFPQEKIHLHTDRTMYVPGEKIWFKAYIVDALTHQSPTYSQYAYIELINAADSLIQRVMVCQSDSGLFHGHFFLSERIAEGEYTIRAYTRYLENLGDDFFFKKTVYIGNLNAKVEQRRRQPKPNYDVSFFPEGGNLCEGVFNKVAIKALNQQGASEFISGEIVDKEGTRICEVTTVFAGMGSFLLFPEAGKEYYLVCKNNSGLEKRFKLPPAQKTLSLSATYRNQRYLFQIIQTPDLPERPLYLLVHCKGEVVYFDGWKQGNEFVAISNNRLPSGIIQALLLDERMNPISERLIFNKNEAQTLLAFSTDKPSYQSRERVTAALRVTDPEGNPLVGHVSVAVTDDKDVTIDTLYSIWASLLLSSELKGHIESPGYYLQNNPEAEWALDLLMTTHGWRRYEIPDVIKGNYLRPKTAFEMTKEISGAVKTLLLGRPVVNGEVMILSFDMGLAQALTDSTGKFSFFVHSPDSSKYFIQAKNQKGRPGVELALNPEKYPKLIHAPLSLSSGNESDDQQTMSITDFLKKAEQRARYDDDMKSINLPEVTVKARVVPKKDEVRLQYWANASSDNTIYREEIEKRSAVNVTSLLNYVGGVMVNSNGTISIRGGGLPLVLIDGMEVQWPDRMTSVFDSPLEMVSIMDVEAIDIFKGPSAAIFGMRGSNGAISITTRRGDVSSGSRSMSVNRTSIIPLGYQRPVAFYSPKYDTPEAKNHPIPDYRTTIFWKPDVVFIEDGHVSFDFYTSDFPSTYSVVIEGMTYDGKIIRQVEKIEVR